MTIKDIAKRCGVSISTVSRVLNNHPDVSEAVRKQVLAVIEAEHYVPNSSARDLVKSQSDTIGLVVRGVGNPFYIDLIHVIEHKVAQAGYALVVHYIPSSESEVRAGAELIRSKKLRGLILLGGCFDHTLDDIALLTVPFVCCTFTNSFGSLSENAYSSVTINDREEARKATKLLIDHGHRSIAIVLDSVQDGSISELRYQGYCQALEEAGIPLDADLVEETNAYSPDGAYDSACRLLKRRSDITAVFTIADAMAMGVIKALHDNGKHVPTDCSVIAIDGITMTIYTIPTLTTLVQPKEQMGEEAVDILVDLIENHSKNRHVVLSTTVRLGGSVAHFSSAN